MLMAFLLLVKFLKGLVDEGLNVGFKYLIGLHFHDEYLDKWVNGGDQMNHAVRVFRGI